MLAFVSLIAILALTTRLVTFLETNGPVPPDLSIPDAVPRIAKETPRKAVLAIKDLKVLPTKANGKAWDVFGGLPDLKIVVRNNSSGQVFSSPKRMDTLHATFNADAFQIVEGDVVSLEVWDCDVKCDDLVGNSSFTVTRELLEQRHLSLAFAQVQAVVLEFRH